MAYASLTAGADYLRHFTTLNSAAKATAEARADLWIDSAFQEWDRSAWTGQNVPPDVARAALIFGSAEYVLSEFAAANPAVNELPYVTQLRTEAYRIADDARVRGWVLANDRTTIIPKEGERSSMNVRLVR